MSKRPTVSHALGEAIDNLDKTLRSEFGQTGFEYHIVGLNKTVAAANIEKAAHLPQRKIKPKIRKGTSHDISKEHGSEEIPQGQAINLDRGNEG